MALYPYLPTLQYVDWRPKKPVANALAGSIPAPPPAPVVQTGSLDMLSPGLGGGGSQLGAGQRGGTPSADESTTETDDAMDVVNGFTGVVGALTGNPVSMANLVNSIVNNTPPQTNLDFLTQISDYLGITDSVTDAMRGLPDPNDVFGVDPFGLANADDVAAQLGTPSGTAADQSQGGNPGTGDVAGDNSSNPGDVGDAGQYARGGLVTKRRLRGPNPPGPDDGSADLDIGEYVIRTDSTKKYGRNALAAINAGEVPANALRSLTSRSRRR